MQEAEKLYKRAVLRKVGLLNHIINMFTTIDTSISKKLKYIVITHGDSYLGQTLAMHLADQLDKVQGQLKRKHRAVRVLCQDKAKLKHLERRGIEVKARPELS